ncbi:unnamed protein product [Adineta steineri]|uniref:Uncharacterized protein n=1 Tax=Adineta steineri TaxID=433720 RepID=A0A814GGF1_9BILA|nr:unnamed protein product [Adineta steineri]CAF0995973.1 unnamed protein product [Adineta steineri]CAF1235387.1 unnamed protein product [Adineta steineri]CAF1345611.1 unnamed protein product [Adineta steineri]CAF3528563.1 unnamed protein product [Adineta steineri]
MCLLVTPYVYTSITVDDQYIPSNDLDTYGMQEHDVNDNQIITSRRAAHFIFPPTDFISPSSQSISYLDVIPTKRQSFGRKHHWDAFFGRRR